MEQSYRIRAMSREEVGVALEWAAREGWNPGVNDAECFYAADAGGFLVGELGGEPVAVISAVRYGAGFGFLGLYIVKSSQRGRGYGLGIWQAAMGRLRGRCIGLDGVVEQQDNYRKSGFRTAHRNVRYEGIGGPPAEGGSQLPGLADGEVVDLADAPFAELSDYDRGLFPDARPQFLRAWIGQPHSAALGVRADGKLAGYGVIRRCQVGHKIGPLFADTPAAAQTLFSALAARAPAGAPVYLDIPEINPLALELVRRHGMKAVLETARMYAGAFPELPMQRVFGITTFELG